MHILLNDKIYAKSKEQKWKRMLCFDSFVGLNLGGGMGSGVSVLVEQVDCPIDN
jgi:hypothetical protein